jgi:hypothetical protein
MTWNLFPKDPVVDLTEHDQYVITYVNRPPLRDAGIKHKVRATGRDGVRTTQRAIRDAHGQVLRVRKAGRWFR